MKINKSIVQYLFLSYAICWLVAGLIYFLEIPYGSVTSSILVAVLCMPAPAIASFIIMKFVLKRPLVELGVNWKTANKTFLYLTPIWLIIWVIFYYILVYVLGSLFGSDLFGMLDFSRDGLLNKIEELGQGQIDPETLNIPSIPVVMSFIILGGIVAGSTINLIFTLGEEIGWRGFLYNQLQDHSLHSRVIFTGFVWGLWHAPLIAMGHNFPSYPLIGIFIMIVFCIVLSYPMDWLRRTSKSVLGPGIFHGMINGTAAGMMVFVTSGNELLSSVVGITGVLAFTVVYFFQNLFSTKLLA
ncbi:MAG: CPBP family intramembrane glutamic endopeptidase [Bacteroidia bacterium]